MHACMNPNTTICTHDLYSHSLLITICKHSKQASRRGRTLRALRVLSLLTATVTVQRNSVERPEGETADLRRLMKRDCFDSYLASTCVSVDIATFPCLSCKSGELGPAQKAWIPKLMSLRPQMYWLPGLAICAADMATMPFLSIQSCELDPGQKVWLPELTMLWTQT